MTIALPFLTLSPTATSTLSTVPACDEGISIEALSLSTVIRLCSTLTVSPGLTKDLDHGHFVEVADVRHDHFRRTAAGRCGLLRRRRRSGRRRRRR
jgi:hypothetical protein